MSDLKRLLEDVWNHAPICAPQHTNSWFIISGGRFRKEKHKYFRLAWPYIGGWLVTSKGIKVRKKVRRR